jgi:NAD(P)-dependent dehydrogenase (short-subunit alcohol dehydrogenase family)
VLGRATGFAERVVNRLRTSGHDVIEVLPSSDSTAKNGAFTRVDPRRREDYRELIARLSEAGAPPQRVLHLWTLAPEGHDADQTDDRWQELGFHSLRQLLDSWDANRLEPLPITVITNGISALAGGDALRPAKATLLGAAAALRQELPRMRCGVIDVATPEPGSPAEDLLLEQLEGELRRGDAGELVAYRGALRFRPDFDRAPRVELGEGPPRRLRPEGVYLITGGLGRVGLALAAHLAHRVRAKLVLTGRSGLPPRATWGERLRKEEEAGTLARRIRAVQALEALGSEVLVLEADVADEDRMAEVVAQARDRLGAINGVIHAAGVLDSAAWRPLRELSWDECMRQFRPKVEGLAALARALEGEDPDFVLLMSSLSAVLGGVGYGAYAAANLFMDAFVEAQHQRGRRTWSSVNWDAWQAEGTPATGGPAAELARLAMTPAEGCEALDRILALGPVSRIIVSSADLLERIARASRTEGPTASTTPGETLSTPRYARPNLHSVYVAPETPTERKLAELWSELLGIERVGLHDNFFELGGTSLVAIQMVGRVRVLFKADLSVAAVFEGPTVQSLSRLILVDAAQGDAAVPVGFPGGSED